MKTIEVYTFEDENGNEDSFQTQNSDIAMRFAMAHGLKCIARIFTYEDSELVWDYTPQNPH